MPHPAAPRGSARWESPRIPTNASRHAHARRAEQTSCSWQQTQLLRGLQELQQAQGSGLGLGNQAAGLSVPPAVPMPAFARYGTSFCNLRASAELFNEPLLPACIHSLLLRLFLFHPLSNNIAFSPMLIWDDCGKILKPDIGLAKYSL